MLRLLLYLLADELREQLALVGYCCLALVLGLLNIIHVYLWLALLSVPLFLDLKLLIRNFFQLKFLHIIVRKNCSLWHIKREHRTILKCKLRPLHLSTLNDLVVRNNLKDHAAKAINGWLHITLDLLRCVLLKYLLQLFLKRLSLYLLYQFLEVYYLVLNQVE